MYSKVRKQLSFIVLVLVIFACSWALLRPDFFRFHDFTQGARIVEMSNALKDGHFPVIWSTNLGYGYGMPLFEFYAPLPYYVGSIFYLLGVSLIGSVKLLIFITSFFTAIGGYLLGRKLFGTMGGLVTSAAITLAPYRAVNLFVRGAISEAWGILFLPFILLGIIKVVKNEKHAWILLVGSIFGLLTSHNLTALIFLPLSVIFGFGYIVLQLQSNIKIKKNFKSIVLKLAGFYFFAVVLSSFYTLPALMEKNYTRLESAIVAEYFDYKLHFVGIKQFFIENWGYGGSTYGPMDGISFYLGFGQLIGLFFSGYIVLRTILKAIAKREKTKFDQNIILYSLILTLFGISLLMATNKSLLIWNTISALEYLQFPWRYLSASIIFLGLSIGALVTLLPNKIFKIGYGVVIIVILLVGNSKYFAPENFTSNLGEYYYSDSNKLRAQMSDTLPDYIPIQIKQEIIRPVAKVGQVLYCQVLENCEETLSGSFEIIVNKVHTKTIKTHFEIEETLIFSISDFPGWSAYMSGRGENAREIHPVVVTQSELGFVQVLVPTGEITVVLKFEPTPIRKIANSISIFGLVILLGTFFWYHKRND